MCCSHCTPSTCLHCRCFFIAQSYVLVKKWSEALVLYERVLKYAKEVQSKAKSLNNSLKVGIKRTVSILIRFASGGFGLSLCLNSTHNVIDIIRFFDKSLLYQ